MNTMAYELSEKMMRMIEDGNFFDVTEHEVMLLLHRRVTAEHLAPGCPGRILPPYEASAADLLFLQ